MEKLETSYSIKKDFQLFVNVFNRLLLDKFDRFAACEQKSDCL
jgi:hypothetical protein